MPQTDTRLAGLASPFDGLLAGAATGVGSLPHRDARAAAEFSLRENELVMIPSLPRRSPAESLIAQAVVGTPGVTLGQYGAIAVDLDRLDPEAPVITDLAADGFGGFRAFLDHATGVGDRRLDGQVVVRRAGHAGRGVDQGGRAGGDRLRRRRAIRAFARRPRSDGRSPTRCPAHRNWSCSTSRRWPI